MMTIWRKEGIEAGMRESIRRVLDTRLGTVPTRVLNALEEVTDTAALGNLTTTAVSVPSYEAFEAELTRYRE